MKKSDIKGLRNRFDLSLIKGCAVGFPAVGVLVERTVRGGCGMQSEDVLGQSIV